MATHFEMVLNTIQRRPSIPFHTFILKPGLKEFLEWCIVQFTMYIWSATQQHNINKYLDQILQETQFTIDPSRVLSEDSYTKNVHFCLLI